MGASFDDIFLDNLRPDLSCGKGDILLPKTSCSVFQSTNLDYLLRNLGVEQLVIVGQLTDQCIESAVRDAADLGYFVTVVEDACAAESQQAQQKGIGSMRGFARIVKSSQVIAELQKDCSSGDSVTHVVMDGNAVVQYLRDRGLDHIADQAALSLNRKKCDDYKKEHANERRPVSITKDETE